MTTHRATRILRPLVALFALALALVVFGLFLTGSVRAATTLPRPHSLVAASSDTRSAIVQFGQDVTVPAGERVEGVVVGGGDITIDGSVKGSVVAFGGDVFVRGTIDNAVIAFGGDVSLARTAVVGRTMSSRDTSIVLVGGTLTRNPRARVTGDVQRVENANWVGALNWGIQHSLIRPWWGFTLMGWIVQTAVFLVLALVAAALMPKQLRAVQRHLAAKPAASLGWGALTFLLVIPAVLVVLVISIVGLLLVLPYMVVVPLFYFFVITGVATLIATRVLAGTQQKDNLMLAVALGVVGTTIVTRIPVAGGLALLAMAMFGAGAAAMAIAEWRQTRKSATGSAPAELAIAPASGESGEPGEPAAPATEGPPVET